MAGTQAPAKDHESMKDGITLTRRTIMKGGGAVLALSASGSATRAQPVAAPQPWVDIMPALTGYIADAAQHRVPDEVRDRARLHVLDTLASIIACRTLEAARLGRAYAGAMGGIGDSPILGSSQTAPPIDAVFASAMTAHAAEINDFIPSAYVQPGPAIVSAALETARSHRRSGRDLTSAVIVGYEIAGRLPKAIGTRNLYQAGLANHGMAPTFGTAAACAPLLGLSRAQVNHMLAYCAQQASGSWQWLLDVRHVEKAFVFAGMGARNGLQAAHMARLGFTGVPDSFDNEKGWFRWRSFQGPGSQYSSLIEGLNQRWELQLAAMKRYPVGGPTQPAVRALLDLRRTIGPEQVRSIRIAMPGEAATFERAAMPALNIPYLAAIIMLDGRLDFVAAQSLDRLATDKAAAEFAQRVTVVQDNSQDSGEGEDRTESARVTVTLTDGQQVERFVPYVPGFPTHPMTRAEAQDKARELAAPVLGKAKANELIALCDALDRSPSVDPLLALMRVPDG